MEYSIEQKAWTIIWYGMHGSPKKVQIEYRKKYGRHARTPSNRQIYDWWVKFFETGSVNRRKKTKTKWVRTELTEEAVLAKFREDVHLTPGKVSKQEGMPSPRSIRRILKEKKFHPFKMMLTRNQGQCSAEKGRLCKCSASASK